MPFHPRNRQRPDLFVAPRVFVAERPGSSGEGSRQSYVFGRLADSRLQNDGCVRELFEARSGKLTSEHFGELVAYHRHIPGECRGMLFNKSQFWLYASVDGDPVLLERSQWTAPGSDGLIRHSFDGMPPPPLLVVLRQLLSLLGLRIATGGGPAFLGAGASGRVFAVQCIEPPGRESPAGTEQPQRMALKVVAAASLAGWKRDLSAEFNAMRVAAESGAPVVPVVPGSLRTDGDDGGGFLMAYCGAPVAPRLTASVVREAFTALQSLHQRNVVHGDARLPNLLRRLDGGVVWVDIMVHGRLAGPESQLAGTRVDARTLAESILRTAGMVLPFPAAVLAAVNNYDCSYEESVQALAGAVLSVVRPAGTSPRRCC